jgi:F5/8 type C domain
VCNVHDCDYFVELPNLALKKPVTSSSQWAAGDAAKAVDGNFNTVYNQNSCFASGVGDTTGKAWWAVDLEAAYNITHVVVTNRADGWGKCWPT